MKNRALWSAIAVCFCVAGCEQKSAEAPKPQATPDELNVFKDNKNDTIEWMVKTKDWDFAANGIEFKDATQQQFSGGASGGAQKFTWKDKNDDDKPYRYKIHLVNGKKKCDVDPSVVNGADGASN